MKLRYVIPLMFVVWVVSGVVFLGCSPDEAEWHSFDQECSCGVQLSAVYSGPFYWFECAKCGSIYKNIASNDVNVFYAVTGSAWLSE